MSYAWGYHGFGSGILNNLVSGTNNANHLNGYVNNENASFPLSHYRLYFTSNHDENSWYGTVFEQFGNAAEAFIVLTSTFRSMPLIYSGEEAGLNQRLLFFDKDEIIWQPHPFADIYSTLFNLKKANKALWNGETGEQLQRVLTTNNPAIFSFIREKDNYRVFEIFNVTDQEITFTFQGNLYTGSYRDAFTNDSVYFSENTEMTLLPWDYRVYEFGSGIILDQDDKILANEFTLSQNYPNPFNPSTNFEFQTADFGFVSLKVFDILGNEVATLINEELPSGKYEVEFKASNLSSGVYFYRFQAGNFIETKKMILMK